MATVILALVLVQVLVQMLVLVLVLLAYTSTLALVPALSTST